MSDNVSYFGQNLGEHAWEDGRITQKPVAQFIHWDPELIF